jgi:S1-C subfamily serine protease
MIRWMSGLLIVAVALLLSPATNKVRADEKKKAEPDKKEAQSEEHGFLGVQPDQNSEGGVVVENVIDDSPAAKAGLKSGDKIIKIDDKDVKGLEDLMNYMMKTKPDQTVKVTYKRGDKETKIEVKLAKAPEQP